MIRLHVAVANLVHRAHRALHVLDFVIVNSPLG